MTDMAQWERLVRGVDCPFDAPRVSSSEHWDLVGALSASSLYLPKSQTYRGQSVLVFDLRHAVRLDQLSPREWASFSADLFAAQLAVARTVRPDHMNVESLGNIVPHLHWHIIPRYVNDPRWGGPIWTSTPDEMIEKRLPDDDRASLIAALKRNLDAARSESAPE